MSRILTVAILGVLALLAPLAPAPQAGSAAAEPPDKFAALLDERMPGYLAQHGVPGSVVAYITDGDVAWTRAYGVANAATGEPMRADMVLEHGSNGKALTAWGVMKLVEVGKIDLDAPVNQYLKRWQIPSNAYDANQVTARMLLSHTSGLNIHGYLDYSLRRANLPTPVQVLESPHFFEALAEMAESGKLSTGKAELVRRPGSGYKYSGAAYTVLQQLIEDVSGEPFDSYMQREITGPLGASSVRWAWTPELTAHAPRPHGNEGQVLAYRQLATHAIGSEIATVSDFARFLAAAVPGPNGEPIGRGVLKPETVKLMLAGQPATDGAYGLGYGIAANYGEPAVSHAGANSGCMAYFFLDRTRRTGFVVASNSARAGPLHMAMLNTWSTALFGQETRTFQPDPAFDAFAIWTFWLAGSAGAALLVSLVVFAWQLRRGHRARSTRLQPQRLLPALPWLLWLALIWYTNYSALPLYLPAWLADTWPSPAVTALIAVLLAWIAFRVFAALYPRVAAQAAQAERAAGMDRQPRRMRGMTGPPEDTPVFGEREPGKVYEPRPGAYAVILAEGKLALVRTARGYFLPGGGCEPGEAPANALRREIWEEWGRAATIGRRLGEAVEYVCAAHEGRCYRIEAVFFAATLGERRAGGEPDHHLAWVEGAQAPGLLHRQSQAWAARSLLDA